MLIRMLKGFAFLLLAALSSRIIFVLNVRQNPQLPWFVLADVLMLVILIRLLAYPSIYSRMRRTPLSVAVLFGVCGVLGSTCVGIIQGWASESHVSSLPPVSGAAQLFSIAAMLFTPLYGGAVEEIVFRGFFQRALEERFGNFIGLISTTAMFVATHAMNSGFESQWMFYLCFSISLGLVAQLSGSLVLCVVLHCGFNAASSIVTRSRPRKWCTSREFWFGWTRAQLTTADNRAV
jgi:membrane protease YdiL (CAAX protease family)